jgi:hypothetical protein
MQTEVAMSEHTKLLGSDLDAEFFGWQKTLSGERFALYNITAADHPSFGSTVTENDLHMLNLQIPGALLPQGSVKKF